MVENITVDQIEDNYHARGRCCRFIKLNDEWGLKCYKREHKRDTVFERQVVFAEHKMAPPVGHKLEILDEEGETVFWCHTTRIATIVSSMCVNVYNSLRQEGEYKRFFLEAMMIDGYVNDVHWENIGFYHFEEGVSSMVLIDFDYGEF